MPDLTERLREKLIERIRRIVEDHRPSDHIDDAVCLFRQRCAVRVSNPGPADYPSAGPADTGSFLYAGKSPVSAAFWVPKVAGRDPTIPVSRLPFEVQKRPLD